MTDIELLKLAAKAAGHSIDGRASDYVAQGVTFDSLLILNKKGGHSVWNPLTNDGDALRLAVGLTLELDICLTGVAARTPNGLKILVNSEDERDIYVATRRTIVRAAAEIGKAMK